MKRKRKIQLMVGLGMAIFITGLAVWSAWFGNNHAQTGFQFMKSIARNVSSQSSSTDIVFLGDSLTAREDWNVLLNLDNVYNAGVSGDTTENVIGRLNQILEARPKKIFLMIGINDLLKGEDMDHIMANYETIISKIKSQSPETIIYIESVLPTNNDISSIGMVDEDKIDDLNNALVKLAVEEKTNFLDLYHSFCGSDQKLYARYSKDGVHLNAKGYDVWKELIAPYIN